MFNQFVCYTTILNRVNLIKKSIQSKKKKTIYQLFHPTDDRSKSDQILGDSVSFSQHCRGKSIIVK